MRPYAKFSVTTVEAPCLNVKKIDGGRAEMADLVSNKCKNTDTIYSMVASLLIELIVKVFITEYVCICK